MILVLNQSPLSTIFAIVRFPGSPKLVLSGDPLYLAYNRVVMVWWWFKCKFIMILTPIWIAFAYISIQQLTFLAGLKNLTTLNAGTAYQINKSSGITFSCLLLTICSENWEKLLLKLHQLQLWTCEQVVHFSTNKYEMHTA